MIRKMFMPLIVMDRKEPPTLDPAITMINPQSCPNSNNIVIIVGDNCQYRSRRNSIIKSVRVIITAVSCEIFADTRVQ